MAALRKAVVHLKKVDVDIEDPGDEIGPEAPGSKNMGVWFRDPDGYRWELNVQGPLAVIRRGVIHPAGWSAVCVEQLLHEGARCVGKTS